MIDGCPKDFTFWEWIQYIWTSFCFTLHLACFIFKFYIGYFDNDCGFMILDAEMVWMKCMNLKNILFNAICLLPHGYFTSYNVADKVGLPVELLKLIMMIPIILQMKSILGFYCSDLPMQ